MKRFAVLCALVLAGGLLAAAGRCEPGPSLLGVELASVAPARSSVSSGDPLIARLGDDPALYGKRLREYDCGFDPHVDAPAFQNFTSPIGPAGDCLGMGYVAQWFYENVRWGGGGTPCADARKRFGEALALAFAARAVNLKTTLPCFANLRAASEDPGVAADLHRVIALEQARNFLPAPLEAFVTSLVRVEDWNEERYPRLVRRLASGAPALIACTTPATSNGHFILAYKVVEFERRRVIFAYDSNAKYTAAEDNTEQTLLVLDVAADRVSFHPRYQQLFSYAFDNFVVYEKLTPADVYSYQPAIQKWMDVVGRAVGGFFRKLGSLL